MEINMSYKTLYLLCAVQTLAFMPCLGAEIKDTLRADELQQEIEELKENCDDMSAGTYKKKSERLRDGIADLCKPMFRSNDRLIKGLNGINSPTFPENGMRENNCNNLNNGKTDLNNREIGQRMGPVSLNKEEKPPKKFSISGSDGRDCALSGGSRGSLSVSEGSLRDAYKQQKILNAALKQENVLLKQECKALKQECEDFIEGHLAAQDYFAKELQRYEKELEDLKGYEKELEDLKVIKG